VDRNTGSRNVCSADRQNLRDRRSRSRRSAQDAAVPLTRRDLLIVTLLSSLGLWAAVLSFASTVPR
jgi:hypothetical protein